MIELMVAVSIVGVLAAIAIPSYQNYIRRGYRAEARAAMLEASQYMQRFYGSNDRYDTATLPIALTCTPSTTVCSPLTAVHKYAISLVAASLTRSAYTLQAVPRGGMATDKCGTLTLTSAGVRGASGTGVTVADCWK